MLSLGLAGIVLGLLMVWQSWDMLDPAWHTEASRAAWFNYLPPLLRIVFMFGVGALLFVIGVANVWVVVWGSPALIIDADGVTALRVLQRRLTVPWREITRMEEDNGRLRLHRSSGKPLVVGYDWFDASPEGIRSVVEERWLESKQGR
jgi:Bacterial PH domain